jgi:hypothetical protein
MPNKATREFIVNAATGEVRCRDPSCTTTQCGQCNKEQNKRRLAARKERNQAAAKASKDRDDAAAVAQARADAAAGKEHVWTYDVQASGEEGDQVLEALQHSDGSAHAPTHEDLQVERVQGSVQVERVQGGNKEKDAFQPEKTRGKTTWNHTTRLLLYKCIAKYNPFAAAVKKDAWNEVAVEIAKSTALMNDPEKGDFRVKSDGHSLEVFYARRVEDMEKVTAKEGTNSGQAGTEVTAEQAKEFAELQACVAKEKDALLIRDNKRRAKSALEDIKNQKVTQLVKDAALEDEVVRARFFKLLQSKVRAAKLEAAVWEKQHGGLGKYSYSQQQLADIESLTRLKKDHPDESDIPDSDGVVDKKKGTVAQAIGDLIAKLPTAPAPAVDPSAFAHAFFQAKQNYQADCAPRKRTLTERLADVGVQHAKGHISDEEKAYYEKEIKKRYFMEDW